MFYNEEGDFKCELISRGGAFALQRLLRYTKDQMQQQEQSIQGQAL